MGAQGDAVCLATMKLVKVIMSAKLDPMLRRTWKRGDEALEVDTDLIKRPRAASICQGRYRP